jgi:hypothetical protein
VKNLLLGLLTALLLSSPGSLFAQERLSLELLPGAAIPTQNMAGSDLTAGVGAEATVSYRFLPHLSAYAGWDWRYFAADASFVGPDIDVEETGYAFGLRFLHPLGRGSAPALMLRAGGTMNHIELENEAGDLVADSGHGLGWEAGAGLAFPVGDRWNIIPAVRFRSSAREFDIGGTVTPATLRYVSVEVGFSRGF